MSRSRLAVVFVASLIGGFASPTAAKDVGSLTTKIRVVTKTAPGQRAAQMNVKEPVQEAMAVETAKERDSQAVFAIGKAQGVVSMGPDSRFTFEEGQFDSEGKGELARVSLRVAFGRFRFLFAPTSSSSTGRGPHPGEIVIRSGGEGSKNPPIRITGTDVFLRVERNGMTTLYVLEGSAAVGEPGDELRVEQGFWTMFGPGVPPQPPAPADGDATTGPFPSGEPEIPPPALLDVDSERFDLPKSRFP